MTRRIAWLVSLYPRAWRERYGEEFAAVLEEVPLGPGTVLNVLLSALFLRLRFLSFLSMLRIAFLFMILLYVASLHFIPEVYRAEATFEVETPEALDRIPTAIPSLILKAESNESLTAIITEENLYPEERTGMRPEAVAGLMRRNLRIKPADTRSVAAIDFSYSDQNKARNAVQRIMNQVMQDYFNAACAAGPKLAHSLRMQTFASDLGHRNIPLIAVRLAGACGLFLVAALSLLRRTARKA